MILERKLLKKDKSSGCFRKKLKFLKRHLIEGCQLVPNIFPLMISPNNQGQWLVEFYQETL